MPAPRYWFALSRRPEQWLIQDLGRWAYPVNWRGSLLILGVILVPIAAILASVPAIVDWPDWALGAFVIAVAGGSTLIGVLLMRKLTDPELTIEDYRARKAALKQGDGPDSPERP